MDISAAADESTAGPHELADYYRHAFGWPVEVHDDVLGLRLTGGPTAFVVQPDDLARISRHIESTGDPYVALRLPGRGMAVAVLVDGRDHVTQLMPLPAGLIPLPPGSVLPLPPSVLPEGRVHWLSGPDVTRRWLPNAATLVAAVHALRNTTPHRAMRRIEPRDRMLMERRGHHR